MKMTFRWYGENDPIPLRYIRQIPGMTGVVTAVYDTPAGNVWQPASIERLYSLCRENGLEMEVIESVPVHEDIKLGAPSRDRLIENYAQTIRNLGAFGVKCICYNFMPVFDWLRTDLKTKAADGSTSLTNSFRRWIRTICICPAGTKATDRNSSDRCSTRIKASAMKSCLTISYIFCAA